MSQIDSTQIICDPETGLCPIPTNSTTSQPISWKSGQEIIYVGDPMCSWCWGISPQLNALQRYATSKAIPFRLIMGGLRPGGGEAWNDDFKNFLRHHWSQVHEKSNQPFGYDLFDRTVFNYDTEPACRAVVTARTLAPEKCLRFYELVQHYFYVCSKDPKEIDFYQPICEELDIDFDAFTARFSSQDMLDAVQQDFNQSRQWGISGFPTVVFRKDDKLFAIARGYARFEQMKEHLEALD